MLVDQDKCRGWRMCISGCPYKKIYYNWHSGKAEKCTFCKERLDEGKDPACVVNCPGKARYFGDLDDPESPVAQFLATHPEAVRVDESAFYYLPVDGMPLEALPLAKNL